MGSQLHVSSEVGRGSKFSMLLEVPAALSKPLFAETNELAESARDAVDGQTARPSLRILVAEDNAVNQTVILHLLKRAGYRHVDVASNGQEVLDCINQQHYDVILMDVRMPDIDGIEATRRIRQQETAKVSPYIIAITANSMPCDREICLAAGMNAYISKPVKLSELVQALRQCESQLSYS